MLTVIDIIHLPFCESTNSRALEYASQGARHGTIVLADKQTHGRGRGKKEFTSPPGGLYMSAILTPTLELKTFSLITLAAGLACVDAIKNVCKISPQLKWPNDLYINSLKLAGVLTETGPYSTKKQTFPYVVVGIGMNINTEIEVFDAKLGKGITSLYELTGEKFEIVQIVKEIYAAMNSRLAQLSNQPDLLLRQWQQKDFLVEKRVVWERIGQEDVHGIALGLTPAGQYRICDLSGFEHEILAGHIRPACCPLK